MEADNKQPEQKQFFDQFAVTVGEVEVGKTYPIFGMVTKLISDHPGAVIVEINHNITARMTIPDQVKIDILKERAFESGIFISRVITREPKIEVECDMVIFGRKQAYHA